MLGRLEENVSGMRRQKSPVLCWARRPMESPSLAYCKRECQYHIVFILKLRLFPHKKGSAHLSLLNRVFCGLLSLRHAFLHENEHIVSDALIFCLPLSPDCAIILMTLHRRRWFFLFIRIRRARSPRPRLRRRGGRRCG